MSKQNEPTLLSRADLLQKRERRTQRVEIPELGGFVIVRSMSALERGKFESYFQTRSGGTAPERLAKAREMLVVSTCVDEQGNKLFTPEDVQALGEQDVAILERICVVAKKLSSISEADIETLVGN